jgi:hypothetical protein
MSKLIKFFTRKKPFMFDSFNGPGLVGWNALIGSWGVSGGRVYSISDNSMDLVAKETGASNYLITCTTNGHIAELNNQRFLNIIFRLNDSTNYLMTRITGGNLHLYKCLNGTLYLLTQTTASNENGRDYVFNVRCKDNDIRVYVDGVQQLQYTLSGGDTVFAGYTKVGLRLTKSGTPTFPANADNYRVDHL